MNPAARRHPFAALLGAFIGVGLGVAGRALSAAGGRLLGR
jgi:hypothetical protein